MKQTAIEGPGPRPKPPRWTSRTAWRAEVVGSLLRPPELKAARAQLERGEIDPSTFKHVEDQAVDDAVRLQEEAGIDVVTDGELRRDTFFGNLLAAVQGFSIEQGRHQEFRNPVTGDIETMVHPVVVAPLRWLRSMAEEEFTYLRARATRPHKITLVSPVMAATFYHPRLSSEAYPVRESYLADVVDCLRREIAELQRLGCTYIQLDSPTYNVLFDPAGRKHLESRGVDPDGRIAEAIELENACVDGFTGITFAVHICRGNHRSAAYGTGDYQPITSVLEQLRVHRFLLEYDDERSGSFEVLHHLTEDKVAVLGLVTTKRAELESAAQIRERISSAAAQLPLERLALSPQCGFGSTWEGNYLEAHTQRQKLELVSSVAHQVWG